MTRSHCMLWAHCVFSTKNRAPLIPFSEEQKIYNQLREQLKKCNCVPLSINGMPDHVHLLFIQDYRKSIDEIMKQVKGATSHWVNSNQIVPHRFGWQDGFGGFSVSERDVARVKNYIHRQKPHHGVETFDTEMEILVRENGIH